MSIKQNLKFISVFFLFAFITAQISLVLHTSKHGVLEHTHAGQVCEQVIFAKAYDSDSPKSVYIGVNFSEYKISYFIPQHNIISKDISGIKNARAPPIYS
jgi:hypothetical protein